MKLATASQPAPSPYPYPSPARGEGTFFAFCTFLTGQCWAWSGNFFQTRFLPLPGATCQGEPDGRVMDRKVPPKNSHWHVAEHRKSCRKGDLHCLRRSRVCKAPAASRSAGHPANGGTRDTGALFLFLLLGTQKKKKGTTKKAAGVSPRRPNPSQLLNNYQPAAINRSISSLPIVSFSNKSLAMASKIARFSLSSRVAVSLASVTNSVTAWSIRTAVSPL